jgi:hypothetical protein
VLNLCSKRHAERDPNEDVIVPTPVLHELVRGALRNESYLVATDSQYQRVDNLDFLNPRSR